VNIKLWLCVAMGVFVAHIAVLMIWKQFQPKPPPVKVNPQAFKYQEKAFTDPDTGEKALVREFIVSTRLATPATETPAPATPAPENKPQQDGNADAATPDER
jgi:hypothetical protein